MVSQDEYEHLADQPQVVVLGAPLRDYSGRGDACAKLEQALVQLSYSTLLPSYSVVALAHIMVKAE